MTLRRISPEEALDLVEDEGWVYVDVRTVAEFEGGHPEGAYCVPWQRLTPAGREENEDFLAVMQATFALDAKIVLGCRGGVRSKHAALAMLDVGFTKVVDQRAGYVGARNAFGGMEEAGWQTQGLPIALEPEAGRDYATLAAHAGVSS